ncbi:unnamed protein product [Fraxinus pennsylvanica]|uniref:Gnk2-homologous domain-containing protein n=1 Tax=Fraxinus pennsylvanica TaxID=56036 RepID=A0AAD1ZPS5_9LAMI|nr:unnamed protein product [Fraxinus pennsylvanica]
MSRVVNSRPYKNQRPNSTYLFNLNQLFVTLSSNATRENGFYNYTVGSGPPNTVYGLFLCRGDVKADACQQCVETATSEVLQRCPKEKRATIWYDYCTLRYSNESLFSRPEQSVSSTLSNKKNITDEPDRFRQLLGETVNEVASEAVNNNPSGEKFATKIAKFTASESLYTLAQCMPYLTSGDCDFCLKIAIPQLKTCCDNKKGGRVIGESCNIRYEVYSFFSSTVAPAPPRTPNIPPIQPSPSSPSSTSQGNGGISKQVIIAIVVPIPVSFVFFFIIRCFVTRRTRKKAYDAFNEENDEGNEISSVESLQYDLNAIALATNNFSADNKIGEGLELKKSTAIDVQSWKLWRDNRPLELMDLTLQNAYASNEVIRCIQIGLLCVQEDADERPNMASILLALNGYSAPLAIPRQPAFFHSSKTQSLPIVQDLDKSTSNLAAFSPNEVSITELHPRS